MKISRHYFRHSLKNKNKQYRQPGGFQVNQGGESQRAETGSRKIFYDSLVLKHSVLADGGMIWHGTPAAPNLPKFKVTPKIKLHRNLSYTEN